MLQSTVAGLTSGGAYALLGVCAVLMYRMVGVVHFAQAAVATFGTLVAAELFHDGTPIAAAAAIGVAIGAGLSLLLGAVMAIWFAQAPIEVRSTVAIAMLLGLLTVGSRLFSGSPREMPDPFPGAAFRIGDAVVTTSALVVIAFTVALAAGVGLLLARTRFGVLVRALSERPVTAELLGIRVRALSVAVWTGVGAAATFGVFVVAPTRPSDFTSLSLLILPGLAAALIGLFRHVWVALTGGLAIGLAEGLLTHFGSVSAYRQVIPFAVVLVVLLWSQRREVWDVAR
ncbi:MAG TPA: branched-chain amino acid ABC transporter permease [Capillimicrobium sp.]|nr:branched-chain amino acid ABC transporter permease [Capillimicrobium sp.]